MKLHDVLVIAWSSQEHVHYTVLCTPFPSPLRLSGQLRQNFPKNVPLLTLFTTAWAAYVGVFSLMFTQGSVTMAVFQTAFVVGESC